MADDSIYIIKSAEDVHPLLDRVADYYRNGGKREFKLEIKFNVKKRSIAQNRTYFGLTVPGQIEYFKDHLRDMLDKLIVGKLGNALTPEFMHEFNKIVYLKGKSTSGLSTEEMETFQEEIRHDMFHDYGHLIDKPGEE